MKKLALLAPLTVLVATPAAATQGMTCRTASGVPLELSLVFGAWPSVMQPNLRIAGRRIPVVVAQSWLEGPEVRVDLYDPNLLRHELRLKVRRNGPVLDGSVWRGGQRRWVRCRES